MHWTVSFVGRGRSERVITEQQEHARTLSRCCMRSIEHEWRAGEITPDASGETADAAATVDDLRESEVVSDRAR